MIWNIILLIILTLWIIIYLKNKKAILSLPYMLMFFFTPIYNILDQRIFVEIFGCGCVPSAQTKRSNNNAYTKQYKALNSLEEKLRNNYKYINDIETICKEKDIAIEETFEGKKY